MTCSIRRLKPSITQPNYKKTPNEPKLYQLIDLGDRNTLLKSQAKRLRKTLPNPESSNEFVPSWMPGTLGCSALMRNVSKCLETSQKCRSGYENPVGEVSDLDSR
jgi:hypothetical protein